MDNKMLISMMGTAAPARDGASTSKSGEVDADAFSAALEKATSGKMGANQSESVIADKSTKKSSDSERRKEDAAQHNAQAEAKLTDPKAMLGSKAYLYQLAYKNVDTMSLAERQALKADKATRDGMGFKDLQRMMSEQGMKLRDLSCTQLADLTRTNSRTSVSNILESIAREKKDELQAAGTEAETVTATSGNAAASVAAQQSTDTKNDAPSLAAAAVQNAQSSAQTQESAQTRRRREVIDQIVNQMELRNLANRDELHLKLNPEYLGELKIQLTQGKDGEVSARFLTTSEDTREVLSESRSDLRKRVEDKGIRLGHIDVDLVDELV